MWSYGDFPLLLVLQTYWTLSQVRCAVKLYESMIVIFVFQVPIWLKYILN